jgi:lysine 6-dehydrogenase
MIVHPPFTYTILGAGRQGAAAAYDLGRFGEAGRILLADASLLQAERAAARLNALLAEPVVEALELDVSDAAGLRQALGPADVALSAVPYYFNLEITRAAIETQTSLCDLGGNTDVVLTQLALDEEARQAGISLTPDCGMGPGLVNTLGAYAIELLDEANEVFIYDAGLPQHPVPPWNYELTFHINGLTNEMDGEAIFLRNGKITRVPTLSEPEMIEFPGVGVLEADVTSGGASTAPWTYEGRLQTYENKVLRFPGHFEWLRAYKTLGLFSEQPILVNGQSLVPRQVYHALLEPKLYTPRPRDIGIMRAIGKGIKGGQPAQARIDLWDRYDEASGFTAMERLTGFHCAIMMGFQARRAVAPGARAVETAVPASRFMEEVARRGIHFEIHWDPV